MEFFVDACDHLLWSRATGHCIRAKEDFLVRDSCVRSFRAHCTAARPSPTKLQFRLGWLW